MSRNKNTANDFYQCYTIHENDCWLWQKHLDRDGYGSFRYEGKRWRAHRLSYKLRHGTIDDTQTIDHLCRNRACVNPEHLELVSCKENLMRGETYAAHASAKTHCKNGHEFNKNNTYIAKNKTRKCKRCIAIKSLEYYHKNKS